MFPPGFSRFGRLGPPGGRRRLGPGSGPKLAAGRPPAAPRPGAPRAPAAPPAGPAALLLQKQPEKAAVAAFSKGPTGSGLFCLAQEYQPLPLLQFFLGVPQGRSQGAAGNGEAFCHIV